MNADFKSSLHSLEKPSVVCFLIVNYIKDLPALSIGSCLRASDSDIVVGYLNEEDLRDIPASPRIKSLKLEIPLEFGNKIDYLHGTYQDFNQPEFFRLVALKWKLFEELFRRGYGHVVYSDMDIIWFRDAAEELRVTHEEFPSVQALIQTDTDKPASPRLCMGIFSIVDSKNVFELMQDCYARQVKATDDGKKISDDDVVTDYYIRLGMPGWIMQLSQTMYPTGRLINSYGGRRMFPGIGHPSPAIFHANWVIGLQSKLLLMRLAAKIISPDRPRDLNLNWILAYKFVRLFLGLKKQKIRQFLSDRHPG